MKRLLFLLLVLIASSSIAQTIDGALKTVTASGTNVYTITEAFPAIYTTNERFIVHFTNGNTGASTLNRNGLGARSIVKADGSALSSGDIAAGGRYLLSYNGASYKLIGDGGGGLTSGSGTTANGSSVDLGGAVSANTELDFNGNEFHVEEVSSLNLISSYAFINADDSIELDAPKIKFNAQLPSSSSNDRIILQSSVDGELIATAKYVLDRATPSTAGGTITLDMNSQIQRMHVGSASFSTPKTIALSNTTNSLVFNFVFTITDVAAVLTLPADFKMSDVLQFDGTDWTPLSTGEYEMAGSFDGTSWLVKIAGPYN